MKIWIDLTNSPHINFFKPFISKWEEEGFEIIITARSLANTISLIKQNGWDYYEVGGHAGKSKIKKLLYFPKRVLSLYKFLKVHTPHIGISHSSFYSPIVSRLLKIPCIYLNDNEHAKGNYIAFKFATLNILPEFLMNKAKEGKWLEKYPIKFYSGIKEGIYLSQSSHLISSNTAISDKKSVFIRLEPWTAQYYSGNSEYMDPLIQKLNEKFNVIILPRSKEQINHFNQPVFEGVTVSVEPIALETIVKECLIFIGAGGSMTRELAFIGIPTISVYQGDLLEVDKYLIENKFMYYEPKLQFESIEDILNNHLVAQKNELNDKGEIAFKFIDEELKKLIV